MKKKVRIFKVTYPDSKEVDDLVLELMNVLRTKVSTVEEI